MELKGQVEHYIMDDGVHFGFRQEAEKESDYPKALNLPFEIYSKFKNKKVIITVEAVKE